MSEHTAATTGSPGTVPPSITRAVLVIYALVAVSALSLILTVVLGDTLTEDFEAANPGTTAPNLVIPAVVSFLLFGALFLFLGFKLKQGAGWSRIVLTVLAVLAVLAGLFTFLGSQPALFLVLSVLSLVLYVALLVLLWQKDTSGYLAAHKS